MEYQSGAVRPIGSIEDGWNLIKDDYWTFFGMTLVGAIILIVVAVILGLINNAIVFAVMAAMGAATSGAGDAARLSAAVAPQIVALFIQIFTSILVNTLSAMLLCGIYTALKRKSSSGAADFGDLFAGFQKFMPCLVVAVVVSVLQFVISLVILLGGAAVGISAAAGLSGLITRDGQLNPAILGGMLVFFLAFFVLYIVLSLFVSALTTFIYPLIADRDLSGGAAILLSMKSGLANLGGLVLLLILIVLMLIGGALACFIGIFFVLPIVSASIFAAYQSVFGRAAGSDFNYAPPPPPNFNNQPGY